MFSVVSLLVAAVLVSQQCGFEANAQIESRLTLDNSLKPNVVAPVKKTRRFSKYVHIRIAPEEEVKRVSGETVELNCVAMGNPVPRIYWMRNGQIVQDPTEEANEIIPVYMGLAQLKTKLIISSSTPGKDEYTCVAEAGVKRDTATSTVYTIPSDDEEEDLLDLQKLFLPSKPAITYTFTELFQELGYSTILPCRAHSLEPSQVTWHDNNERPIYGNSRMRVLPSGDLLISILRWEDLGNFICTVKNAYGKDSAITFVYPTKA